MNQRGDKRLEERGSVGTAGRPRTAHRGLVLGVLIVGAVCIAIWAGLRATGRLGQPARPKNVLLITMDTTRADYLGCFGSPAARTPNIDRLSREGTIFTRCSSCAPLTLPSHASMMTAVYPYAHGARENGTGRLAEGVPTLAETFRAAGYTTQATVASFVLNRQFGVARGFDVYHDVTRPASGDPADAERKGDEVCDDALGLLRGGGEAILFVGTLLRPTLSVRVGAVKDILSPRAYADEITFMDTQIGRLLDEIQRLGHERDTLVVAVADHGEGLNDHAEWKHGYFLYETTLRTALLLRCPGIIPAAKTVAAQVRTIDLAPTILALVGLPVWESAQGVSLTPLLDGRQQDLNLAAYGETFQVQIEYGLSPLRSWSAGGWKYVWKTKPELYHVSEDPEELHDLVAAEPQRAADMQAQLRQLIADAPPPPARAESTTALSEDDRKRLASLGYVGRVAAEQEGLTELERFEPRGADPTAFARSFKLTSWDVPQLLQRKEYAQAEQLLRQLIAELPEAAYLPALLGGVLESQGRLDEAEQAFARGGAGAGRPCGAHEVRDFSAARSGRRRRSYNLRSFWNNYRMTPER